MIKIKKENDGASLTIGSKRLNYCWNEYSQDDFKKMLDDIRDLLGVPVIIRITTETLLEEDTWND